MRVIIIANGFQPHYIINLLNGLASSSIKIDFIGSDIYPVEEIDPKVNFLNLRGSHEEKDSKLVKIKRILLYYSRLLSFLVKNNCNVVHIQWLRFNLFEGILGALLIRSMGKKVVYTAHDVMPHMKENVFNRIIFYLIYRSVSLIIVHTDFIRNRIIDEFKVNKNKIRIIKHGVYEVKTRSELTKRDARSKLDLSPEDHIILFFGNITAYKGLNFLINAFSKIMNRHASVKLIIAGKIDKNYVDEFTRILNSVDQKGIITKFGYLPDDEIEPIFKSSDVTILPYIEASQSGVLFLSYAYGRPVIAPNIGNFPNDIIVGKTGFIFKVGDENHLADTIDGFFNSNFKEDPGKEKFIKEYANSEYSWAKIGNDLKEVYSQ